MSSSNVEAHSYQENKRGLPDILEPSFDLDGPTRAFHSYKKTKRDPVFHSGTQSHENSDHGGSFAADPEFDLPPISLSNSYIGTRNDSGYSNLACFGLIHNIQTKLLDTTTQEVFGSNAIDTNSKDAPSFKLRFQSDSEIVCLTTSALDELDSHADFAILNEKTGRVLCQMKNLGCHFETLPSTAELNHELAAERKMYIYVDVTVAGPKNICNAVGTLLSTAKFYLQHPETTQIEKYAEYQNPHFLTFDKAPRSMIMESERPLAINSSNEYSLGVDIDAKEDNRLQPKLHKKVTKILNSLTRGQNLKRIEANIKIITPLLQHQAEALDFIAQREFGSIPDEYSLWTPQRYENQICIMQTSKEAEDFFDSSPRGFEHDKSFKYKVRSRSTLVIVQTSLLIDGWREEIAKHCRGYVNINIYHGRGRETSRKPLINADIVLSTYDTISAESLDPESPVYGIEWFRLVLDEAHRIRNMKTKLFRAMSQLSANIRWCLTGTPIQNSLDDLAALVSFVRSSPLDELPVFRKHIINPLLKEKDEGAVNLRTLLDSICLRRTKKLLNLPSVVEVHRPVYFSFEEKSLYDLTQREEIQAVKQQDSQGRNKKGYFGIFQLQLQLRRICNHGTFLKRCSSISQTDTQFDPEQALGLLQEKKESRCHDCNVEIEGLGSSVIHRGRFTTCGHLLCFDCVSRYRNSLIPDKDDFHSRCSICSQILINNVCFADEVGSTRKAYSLTTSSRFESTGIASKMKELLKDITRNQTRGKSIIFSCWTTSLDLVGHHLKLCGLPFERIDGSCTRAQRYDILQRYTADETIRILIMTTGTGAEGLNITVANYVYILEPQWNPMVEAQAIARVQRIGQNRDVKIFRYIVEDTVEKGIQARQSRKLDYARMGWTGDELELPDDSTSTSNGG
ncbi:putative snf2 family dna-dependent atpase protein [Botrytis fragariae]|uniref:Putative snf2 family dna-dependent atpase protein n=1 Tax=Botrytis fragariae TaxID=1964551 RepID=A0A8H6EK38_9HELO|nr:putative snf2 family dna-dependent atpase protein [Botrytis fragariae]KAF5875192.1 putative snf2 family dna-dependent atpase protein [Botrytis fragariae]